ncbi:hypothetical protein BDZ97DRAFT_1959905 [Flammula alnicola]|nr:hypothetical protein BDZ97DRAFT_1959905 [Flammula alnicola]
MVNRRISDDLKMAALRLKARGRDSVREILQIVRFSRKTFYRVQRRYHQDSSWNCRKSTSNRYRTASQSTASRHPVPYSAGTSQADIISR